MSNVSELFGNPLTKDQLVQRLDRIHAMQAAAGLTPAKTKIVPARCGRCGDTDRFDDHGDSVCSTCGRQRAGGYDERWVQPADQVAYLTGRGFTPDDMLAWLRAQGWDVYVAAAQRADHVSVDLYRWDDWNECNESGPGQLAPTLQAALEAAVRAVVEW